MTESRRPTLRLVQAAVRANTDLAHRASENEGEAAIRLLTEQGYVVKNSTGDQVTTMCPFHEGPGEVKRSKSPNFYMNKRSSVYMCHAASCGERGNLRTLEKFFGIGEDSGYVSQYVSMEQRLVEYERALTSARRKPFYEHGLTDQTIERFRYGYDEQNGRYVIPYLEGRRPRKFRYYQPYGDPKYKYTWEQGTEVSLYNSQDAMGDAEGRVLLCESELKAALAVQLGYAAVGVPGAGLWRPEWQAEFTHARAIIVIFDNDSPEHHIYDKPDQPCRVCQKAGLPNCRGHNPGQEAAAKRVDQLGWRARNVVLPLPEGHKKVDINDYFVRDGGNADDFKEMVTGKKSAGFRVASRAEQIENPPEEAVFLVSNGILPKGGRLLLTGPPKGGKAQRLSSKVLTPTGWTRMGDLHPGDQVVSQDGTPATVLQIHPQGEVPIFRVHMSDGTWTDCTREHLWTVQSGDQRQSGTWRTYETHQIQQMLESGQRRKTYMPMVEPIQFHDNGELPLDAYALGLLLGDGSFAHGTPTFCKPEPELWDALKALPTRITVIDEQLGHLSLPALDGRRNELTVALKVMGLMGKRSWEKHVPDEYLFASVEDRLAILQGLMDTDGWVEQNDLGNTSAFFCTTSPHLRDGVKHLVESLGGQVRVIEKRPKYQGGVGRLAYIMRVRLPSQFSPFRLTAKWDKWVQGRTAKNTRPVRRIVKIEPIGTDHAQCITIDREDGLYVTENFIVTHNSIMLQNLALSLAAGIPFLGRFAVDHPTRVLLLDRELSRWSLHQRFTQLENWRPGYRAAAENLLIDHDHLVQLDQPGAEDLLLNLVAQNGAEVLMLDTAYKFFGGDMDKSSSVSKAFKVLDKVIHETGVSIVLTHHHRKGQPGVKSAPDADQVAGSFLWTGWPNATILLNFLKRSVENPFNTICTFTAFRDAPAPEPLVLYRDRDSIGYTGIEDYSFDEDGNGYTETVSNVRPDTQKVSALLLDWAPIAEEKFVHMAAAHFGCTVDVIKPLVMDAVSSGAFTRTGRPLMLKYAFDPDVDSWEKEHNLPERRPPVQDVAMLIEE